MKIYVLLLVRVGRFGSALVPLRIWLGFVDKLRAINCEIQLILA